MLIKIINQGTENGAAAINYLLSESKHQGAKPVVVSGMPELTKEIISNTHRKQKYTSGVISFREGEDLSEDKKLELIERFQKTFAPFDDPERVNFLWVEHRDKGRLELHFLCPKTDLKTGKAFNISPPGKRNQAFYNHFVRLQNAKHGFLQVDKRPVSTQSLGASLLQLQKHVDERKSYIANVIDGHKSPPRRSIRKLAPSPSFRKRMAFTRFLGLRAPFVASLRNFRAMDELAHKLKNIQKQGYSSEVLDFSDGKVKLTRSGIR